MRARLPMFIFVLIIPILTELLTANMLLPVLFVPTNFLFLVLFYSVPILIIREVTLRYSWEYLGYFSWGLHMDFSMKALSRAHSSSLATSCLSSRIASTIYLG